MSSAHGSRGKKIDPLQKKIPENPKYKNVRHTVDTGASMSRYMAKIDDIKQNYKFKKNEIFKRMKVTTFVQLAIQVQRITAMEAYDDIPPTPVPGDGFYSGRPDTADRELQQIERTSPVPSLALTEGDYGAKGDDLETGRSSLLSVMRGMGELDFNQPPPAPANRFVNDVCPYLLLDVRETDDYNQCHILSAQSYPKAQLSKATNYESKEMLSYKNKDGKIILIYDEDERIAPVAAETLVQRGYDNLFMLSGGLKVASRVFPDGLITGTLPETLTSKKAKNVEPTTSSQKTFTTDNIDSLEMYLDNALQDHSIGSRLSKASTSSSRMSKASSARTMTAQSSSSMSTISERPPFR